MRAYMLALALGLAVILFPSAPAHAQSLEDGHMFRDVGNWTVGYEADTRRLVCFHCSSKAQVTGTLDVRFADGTRWTVIFPRDSVDGRLAILGDDGNVHGYLTFTGSGDCLRITPVHRAAKNYQAHLHFTGTTTLGKHTFACRTRPDGAYNVVQMASGGADSLLNDSLFDIDTDTVLRFSGAEVRISQPAPHVPVFQLEASAAMHDASCNAVVLEVVPDYYRARYVPYYKPINKERCPSPPTGWMSWNTYFDKADENDNIDEARVGAKYLKPFGLEFWHIESWQDNSDQLPVSTFHCLTLRPNPRQFPHGMKWLADQIYELGFRPGIWTVPFGTGDAEYYEAHKDWFLHNPDGTPMRNWCGLCLLDPSQEAVRQHMEQTHRIMSMEWGYEYFKIDGMSGRNHSYSAHFFERDEVRAAFKEPCEDPFRLCVEALRRGIGPDRVWLACQGHYSGPEIGLADAGRLGADIVGVNNPPDWHNYRHQASTTVNQLFVNNIVWYNDPDTLLVAEPASMDLARLATSVVGLPGQMMFAGDKLAELPPERMRLLQQVLPVCDVLPLDLYPIFAMPPVWDLKIRRPFLAWDVVSLFNWNDETKEVTLQFAEAGLSDDVEYVVYDFWNHALLGTFRDSVSLETPGRGNRLLAVHPVQDHPQFLSTDRHITQGAISLTALAWDEATATLTGTVELVENNPAELVFRVPKSYTFTSAQAPSAGRVDARTDGEQLLRVTLETGESGPVEWQIDFAQ